MKEYKEITKEAFEKFINTASERNLIGEKEGYVYNLFKMPFDEEFKVDLIYTSRDYLIYKEYNFIPEKFEMIGAVCNETNDILLSSYYLGELIRKTKSSLKINYVSSICNIPEDMSKELTKQIRKFWNKIKTEAQTESYSNDEYTKKYRAKEKAEEWFVKDNLISVPEYSYKVYDDERNSSEDLLLTYYIKKEETLSKLVENYLSKQKEAIYKSILCYEEACKILPTLLNDEGLKIEKTIKEALKDLDCNMVTVKASKETLEGRFTWEGKVELASLKNCKSKNWIYLWRTPLSERKEFHKLFGTNADLFPEDIDEISFRKKILYKKGE